MDLLTSSSSALYRACPRAYRHRMLDGLVAVGRSRALSLGTLVHHALEAWWRCVPVERRLGCALAALEFHRHHGDLPALDLVRAEVMLSLYDARWRDAPLTALVVEGEYAAPLVNPETGAPSRTYQRAGKVDVIARDETSGRVLLVEHKTSRESIGPGSEYWQRLTLNAQVSHYYAGAEALGYRLDGCIYDVLAVPTAKPYQATPVDQRKHTKAGALYANQREHDETLDEYRARITETMLEDPDRWVRRAEVVRLEDDMRDAAYDDWQTAGRMRESRRLGVYPRNPDACFRYHRACDYLPICQRAASADDPLLYRIERPHAELSGASGASTPETTEPEPTLEDL